MTDMMWEVYAVKYDDRNNRMRVESFILDPAHDQAHPMDYFVWAIVGKRKTYVLDTGFDQVEGEKRGRIFLRQPAEGLRMIGVEASNIDELIISHRVLTKCPHYTYRESLP